MTRSVRSACRRRLRVHCLIAGAMLASFTLMPAVASDYEFSYGPRRLEWTPGYWHGKHEFPGVFCLAFPRPQSASSLDTGMLNGNAITFVRANYDDRMAAYVVTSTLPEGLSEADDFASLMANEQRNATQINAVGGGYDVSRIDTPMGPGITVRVANVREDAPEGPFPLVRHVFYKDNGPIVTMSAHRLFVRGGHRFEVAVLGAADATLGDSARAALQEKIDAHADQMLASLQECTAKIPPSWVKQTDRPSRGAADIGGPAKIEMKPADATTSAPTEADQIRARATELQTQADHAGALQLWEQLAAKGDKDSMIEAGLIHHQGLGGVAIDYNKAMDWYLKALNADALNNLGVMYRDGSGVPRNRKISYLLFLTVHMQGMGREATISRANRNLRKEIAELADIEKQEALCYTQAYFKEYLDSRGKMTEIPERLQASPDRKRFKELPWWMPAEIGPYECLPPLELADISRKGGWNATCVQSICSGRLSSLFSMSSCRMPIRYEYIAFDTQFRFGKPDESCTGRMAAPVPATQLWRPLLRHT